MCLRLISVNDFYDSNREMSSSERLANPIINLMNEYHVMETLQKDGKFIGNRKGVRMIFDLKIDGMNRQAIGDYLISEPPTFQKRPV